jgi:hypothetical protein
MHFLRHGPDGRVTELEDEVARLKSQLARAKGINDVMWETLTQTAAAQGKETRSAGPSPRLARRRRRCARTETRQDEGRNGSVSPVDPSALRFLVRMCCPRLIKLMKYDWTAWLVYCALLVASTFRHSSNLDPVL